MARHGFRFLPLVLLFTSGATALPASAQQAAAPVKAAVQSLLTRETTGLPGQVKVSVGDLDTRNQLPPCQQMEAFLPAGVRAWGQISVGVRCARPAPWTVFIPARVEVIGPYLVSARGLGAGITVGPADLGQVQGDLTALPDNVLTDPSRAVGQTLRIAIAANQPLRTDMLRQPPVVRQGERVKVIYRGAGFEVGNEGNALNTAGDGEPVRVRMGSKQVVNGIARAGGIVEIVGP